MVVAGTSRRGRVGSVKDSRVLTSTVFFTEPSVSRTTSFPRFFFFYLPPQGVPVTNGEQL